MPDQFPDPSKDDIVYEDRRISRPDASVPDWEVPDTSYRPVPIVWFTAAMIVQMIAIFAAFTLLLNHHGLFTVGVSALVTGMVGAWTWNRGMKNAGSGWKLATIFILVGQLAFVSAAVSDRI